MWKGLASGLVAVVAVALVPSATAMGQSAERAAEQPLSAERAGDRYPVMREYEAESYSRKLLRHKFDDAYESGYQKKNACDRMTRKAFRCRVSWNIGDTSYKGWTKPFWCDQDERFVYWCVEYRIEMLNYYCLNQGGSRDSCTKVWRGRW